MKSEIRAFIAIELPDDVKAFLGDLVSFLKKRGADVKWVKPEGMHLTLKFLGNVRTESLESVEHASRLVFSPQTAIYLAIKNLGSFPTLKRPRVVWAGCEDAAYRLPPLVATLEDALGALGFEKEKRPYNPHLTLGRVRSNEGTAGLVAAVRERMDLVGPGFVADHAVLFESVLSPSGAQYSQICRFEFS
jgi:2'-5' RNA ligase